MEISGSFAGFPILVVARPLARWSNVQRRSQALGSRGLGARAGYRAPPQPTGFAWDEPSDRTTSFRNGPGRQAWRPLPTRGGRGRGGFRSAPPRAMNLSPSEPPSLPDWETHCCVLDFYPPDRRIFPCAVESVWPMGPDGPVRPPGAPTPPCAMRLDRPMGTDGSARPPVGRTPSRVTQSEWSSGATGLAGLSGPRTSSCGMAFEGPIDAGGFVRPPVERTPSFVMRAEQPTRAGGSASPPGRRPLSPEYPSSIADALRHEQDIFRRALAAKRRSGERPPTYEEVTSPLQTSPFSRPGDRRTAAEAHPWRPPARVPSPEPDQCADGQSQGSRLLTRSSAAPSNASDRGRSPSPSVAGDSETASQESSGRSGIRCSRLFARLLR